MSIFNRWQEGVPMNLRLKPLTRGVADGVSEVPIMVEIIQNGRIIAAPIPYQITMTTTLGKLNATQRTFPRAATRIYFLLTSSLPGRATVSARWGGKGTPSSTCFVVFDKPRFGRVTPKSHRAPPADYPPSTGEVSIPGNSTIIVSFQPDTKLVRGVHAQSVSQPKVKFQTYVNVNGQFTLSHIPNGTYSVTPLSMLEGGKVDVVGKKVTFQPNKNLVTCSGNNTYRLTFKKFEVSTV